MLRFFWQRCDGFGVLRDATGDVVAVGGRARRERAPGSPAAPTTASTASQRLQSLHVERLPSFECRISRADATRRVPSSNTPMRAGDADFQLDQRGGRRRHGEAAPSSARAPRRPARRPPATRRRRPRQASGSRRAAPGPRPRCPEPVEVEVGDRHPARVALADREGRRGDRLLDAERPAGAADQGRLARRRARPLTSDDVAGLEAARRARRPAPRSRPRRRSLGGSLSRRGPSCSSRAGREPAARLARPRAPRPERRAAAARAAPGSPAKSSRSVSATAGVRSAAAGMEERQQEDRAPAERVDLGRAADPGDPRRVAGEQLRREVAERADDRAARSARPARSR